MFSLLNLMPYRLMGADMKKIVLYIDDDLTFDYSKRKLEQYEVVQKPLWRHDLPLIAVKIFRRTGQYTVSKVLNTSTDIGKYDLAIIPEYQLTPDAFNYILRKPIASKQIILFRNKVNKTNYYILENRNHAGLEICTYNLKDAHKYKMLYQPQCWNKDFCSGTHERVVTDLYFVGTAKDRYQDIISIKNEAERQHLVTDFTIVSNHGEPMTTRNPIPYTMCLQRMKQSRAILDIVGADNEGLTYRPLEALFLQKKLITNYLGIQHYDFYAPNRKNIFLIGVDHLNNLAEFIQTPFVKTEFSMDKYDIVAWMDGIIQQVF